MLNFVSTFEVLGVSVSVVLLYNRMFLRYIVYMYELLADKGRDDGKIEVL